MHVAAVIKRKGNTVVTASPDQTVGSVADLLTANRIGAVLVLEDVRVDRPAEAGLAEDRSPSGVPEGPGRARPSSARPRHAGSGRRASAAAAARGGAASPGPRQIARP